MNSTLDRKYLLITLLGITIFFICNFGNVLGSDHSSPDYALSSVSLLLPYSTSKYRKPVKLEANKGCFEWTTSNPDLIEIIPIYESDPVTCDSPQSQFNSDKQESNSLNSYQHWDQANQQDHNTNNKCAKSINIIVRNPGSLTTAERNSAFIYAEERSVNRVLQCEVFVDKISSIVIETTTKTMYKDDVEELHVRAYDSVGNVFSSIVGLEFEWSIVSGHVLQIVPFRGFLDDDVALKMEQAGLQTSFVLVQGVDTGRTQIQTKLTDSSYQDIQHSTTLSILEPLQLNPNYLLYVIPGTQIQYQLLTKKRTVLENIKLPNSNYLWTSSNSKVGTIDNSGLFMAMEIGKTELKVQHFNMSDNKVQSLVNVVNPSYLSIKIEPLKPLGPGPIVNWNLIQTKNYILIVELYDASGHKIYNPDINYDIQISNDHFEPIPLAEIPKDQQQKRNDYYYLKAIKQGTTTIKAQLKKIYDLKKRVLVELLQPISVEQPVNIHSEIFLSPPIIYLPYIPKLKQTYQLKPHGGSGEYQWFTNNSAIVGVDSTGLITSQYQPGNTEIILIDKKNPHNRNSMMVYLLEPNEISIISTPSNQVQTGEKVTLSLKLKSNQIPRELDGFDSYQLPTLPWRMEDEKIFKPEGGNIFTSQREGSSLVSIEFQGMKANLRLFSFENLRAQPSDYIILSLGSSKQVNFIGGPEPWYLDPKTYYQHVQISDQLSKNQIQITPIQSNSFTVTCLQHASGTITLNVGNKVSGSNQNPISQTLTWSYSCQLPKSIEIQIVGNQNNVDDGNNEYNEKVCEPTSPTSTSTIATGESIKIRNRRNINLEVVAFDENGKQFTNQTSILYEWSLSDDNKASIIKSHFNNTEIKLYDKEGKLQVKTQMVGYNQDILKGLRLSAPKQAHPLKAQLDLYLISTVKLEPEQKLLYNNDKNLLTLRAVGGSKNFKFSANNTKISNLIHSNDRKDIIQVQPTQAGYLKVYVNDICVQQQQQQDFEQQITSTFASMIQISEVHSIDLQSFSMVQVGNSIDLKIKAYSMSGDEFEVSEYQYMNILVNIDNPSILSVSPSNDNPQLYQLKGIDQGLVSLTVTISNPKTLYSTTSKTIQIQVFPPFKVSQQSLHLVPGGQFQIHWTGGNLRQEVTFESFDSSIVAFSSSNIGELKALKVGETQAIAKAHIIDTINNKKVLIGEDRIKIFVKSMTGIRIHCTIDKLITGNEAKLRVVGENGETPFTYGTSDLYFKWEILDNNIASLLPIYEQFNSSVELEGSFSIRVLGKNPGSTSVTVWAYSNAQISRESPSKYLFQSTSYQITIIPIIPIPTSTLLLPLNSISNHPFTQLNNVEYVTLGGDNCADIIKFQQSPTTKLTTLDKIGTCLISVRRQNHLDTSKLMMINTKPFSHLEVLPTVPSTNSGKYPSMVLSISETMSFICYLRDNIGELFSEYGNVANLIIESSNTGIVGVTMENNNNNFTIINVKGIRAGIVTLHLYLKDQPHLDDYIKIFVGKFIEPESPILHVGSLINFKLKDKNLLPFSTQMDQSEGRWDSSDSNLIVIDQKSGKAKALKAGKTFIHYLQNPSSSTLVVISQVSDIQVDQNSLVINVNQVDSKEYKYPLKFFNSEQQEFTSLPGTLQQNIKGSCSIKDYSSFASTLFEFDNSTGQYNCIVKPTGQIMSIDKLELLVQVSNVEKTYLFEKVFTLPFESSFSILNLKGSKIQLSQYQRDFKLVIQSNKEVFVDTNSKFISIQPFQDIDTSSHKDRFKFLIQAIRPNEYFNDETISISTIDKNNQQQSKSQIIFVSNQQHQEKSYISILLFTLIILIILISTFYYAIQYNKSPITTNNSLFEKSKFNPNQSTSNFSSSFNNSTGSGLGNSSRLQNNSQNFQSPYRTNNNQQSSQLPQSFQSPNQRSTLHLRESIYQKSQNNQF